MGSVFGKGGGSQQQQPTNQTVTQTNLPEYARPYFENLMNTAQGLSQQPYPTYQGPRLADLSSNQQSAIGTAGQAGAQAGQQLQQGSDLTTQAGIGSLGIGGSTFGQAQANQYMSPYLQSALNPALAEIQRGADINIGNVGLDAASHGALGGYREGIQRSEMQRNADVQKNQVLSQGYQSAFQNAQQQYNMDRGAQLQGYGQAMGAGAQLGQMGQQGLMGLQTTGALQQQQRQSALDLGYSDFMNSMNFPRQQANFMSGILRGVPVTASSDVQQFQAPPSAYSQLMGLGLAGAGIGRLVGGG